MDSSSKINVVLGEAQKQEVGEVKPPANGDAQRPEKGKEEVAPPHSEEDLMIQLEALAGNRVGAAVDAMATKEAEAHHGVCALLHLSATGERGEHSNHSIVLSGRPSPATPSTGIHLDIRGHEVSLSTVRVDATGVAERAGDPWVVEDAEAARAIAIRVRALAASRKRFPTVSLAVRWLAKHAALPSLRPTAAGRPDRGSAYWDHHAAILEFNRPARDKKKKDAVDVLAGYQEWRHGIREAAAAFGADLTEKEMDEVVREAQRESERKREAKKEAEKMAKMAAKLDHSREETRKMLREAMDGEEPTEEDIDHVLGSIAKRRQVEKGPRVGGKKAKAGSRREMKLQPILDWPANLARAQQDKKEEEERAAAAAAAAAHAATVHSVEKEEEKGEISDDVSEKDAAAVQRPIGHFQVVDPSIVVDQPLVPYPLSPPEHARLDDTTGSIFEMDEHVGLADLALPADDSIDSPTRPRRHYVRRSGTPAEAIDEAMDQVSPRRERRGADYKEDNEEEEEAEIDWDARELEAEVAACSKPGCVKRRKEYEVVNRLSNEMQEERRIEEDRADRAEAELEKVKQEKEELAEMLKMVKDEQAARALAHTAEPIEMMDLDGDDGVQKDLIQSAVSLPPSPVRSPVASPLRAPVRVRARASAPARAARVARVTRKMEKTKERLRSLKKLEPSVWNRHAAGPAMKKQWKTITATIGARRGKIQRGAVLTLAHMTPMLAKSKEHKQAVLTLCDTSKAVVNGFNALVDLAKKYANEVASAHIVLGGGPRKVCQSTPEMERLAKEFEQTAKTHMKNLHAWEKQSATLPVC